MDLSAGASCGEACTSAWSGYYGTFDDAWEPDRRLARGAFEVCVGLSREQRVLSEYTLTCEQWLAQNYRFEYQHHDELFPTAGWVNGALGDGRAVLLVR